MATVGTRQSFKPGRGYENDPMHAYAQSFLNIANAVVKEDAQDVFGDPRRAFGSNSTIASMKDFFIENSYDKDYFDKTRNPQALQEHMDDMDNLFQNDLEAVNEYAAMATYNPVLGLTFPIHKYILMNCMFDKCIPHAVAVQPRFTISIETRYLVTPEGEEIDMFRQQNKIYSAMVDTNPLKTTDIDLPEFETVDILKTTHNRDRSMDNLSTETYISAVKVEMNFAVGDINPETGETVTTAGKADVWLPVDGVFGPGYGDYDRTVMFKVEFEDKDTAGKTVIKKDAVSAYMKKNMFMISSASGVVKAVRMSSRVDPSNAMLQTCQVKWSVRTDVFDIPNATPINVPISPEETKDINAMYNVNQVTKIMSMINVVLGNYKDDSIKVELDNSFKKLPDTQKFSGTFDFVPRDGYYSDHIEWRRATFMDALDTYVQQMIQVWNDPNVTVSVVGRAELIRKITPTEYTYQSPANIGPVDLDFVKTVVTSDKRTYTFMSSDKMRDNNNLIIILNPKNSERIMYKLFDYQAYVSNEIRNAANPALPAMHAFERFKFLAYQPVQSRIRILNPMGLREQVENYDPIGKTAMNDFTANRPEPKKEDTTTTGTGTGTAGGGTGTTPPTGP